MRHRTAARLAWGLWALSIVLAAVHVTLVILARHVHAAPGFGFPGSHAVLAAVFASVGVVVASRQPSNPFGWIFLAVGADFGVLGVALGYALVGLLSPHAPLPGAVIGAWLNTWLWFPAVIAVTTLVFQLFPDGRFLSPRWRRLGWITAIVAIVASIALALKPGPLEHFATANPFGINSPIVVNAAGVGFMLVNLAIIASVASLVVRYRRTNHVAREQIKWLAYAGVVAAVLIPVGDVFSTRFKIVDALILLAVLFIPIAMGIAVLRYRLYDIDRIISRTLSYAFLTGALGGMFALVVLVPTAAIGSGKTPGWLVAIATLVAFGLFRPLRRRFQNTVDHRFNRSRYDAIRTVESFSARLRDQVDLETLRDELTAIVGQTMQPSHVTLWLRPEET
jgi:hypothetical protein